MIRRDPIQTPNSITSVPSAVVIAKLQSNEGDYIDKWNHPHTLRITCLLLLLSMTKDICGSIFNTEWDIREWTVVETVAPQDDRRETLPCH